MCTETGGDFAFFDNADTKLHHLPDVAQKRPLDDQRKTEMKKLLSDYEGELHLPAALFDIASGSAMGSAQDNMCLWCRLLRNTAAGNERCRACDMDAVRHSLLLGAKPLVYKCHSGILEYVLPIKVNGKIEFVLIGGQFRTARCLRGADLLDVAWVHNIAGFDPIGLYGSLFLLDESLIDRLCNFLKKQIAARPGWDADVPMLRERLQQRLTRTYCLDAEYSVHRSISGYQKLGGELNPWEFAFVSFCNLKLNHESLLYSRVASYTDPIPRPKLIFAPPVNGASTKSGFWKGRQDASPLLREYAEVCLYRCKDKGFEGFTKKHSKEELCVFVDSGYNTQSTDSDDNHREWKEERYDSMLEGLLKSFKAIISNGKPKLSKENRLATAIKAALDGLPEEKAQLPGKRELLATLCNVQWEIAKIFEEDKPNSTWGNFLGLCYRVDAALIDAETEIRANNDIAYLLKQLSSIKESLLSVAESLPKADDGHPVIEVRTT